MRQALCLGAILLLRLGMQVEATCLAGETATRQQIAALVAKLNSDHYAERELAAERLLHIGGAAKVQLEAASRGDSLEVRRRAERLLVLIEQREFGAQLKAFAAGDPNVVLPGWTQYRQIMGDSPASRKLFVEMQQQESTLLAMYDKDIKLAGQMWALRCAGFAQTANQKVLRGSVATLLLIIGDERVVLPENGAAYGLMTVLNNVQGGRDKALRKLLARYIRRPCDVKNRSARHTQLELAIQYKFNDEALGIAVAILEHLRTEQNNEAHQQGYLMHLIGWLGNRSHIKVLEPSLEDARVAGDDVQVRDIALAAIVHLSGQKGPDHGLKHVYPEKSWGATPWDELRIKDAEKRDETIAKWRAWAKNHLKPSVETAQKVQDSK